MAASMDIDTLIAAVPSSFTDEADVSEWLAKVYRFSDLNDYPEVKESSWIGLARITDLNARMEYRETCLSQLKAIKAITVVSSQQ